MTRRKGYIFTNKRHSEKAIMATILGIISLASMGIVVFLSYSRNGDAPAGYGVTGILATIFSLIGLVMGLMTVKEVERYHFFPWLGIILNGLSLVGIFGILYVGVNL